MSDSQKNGNNRQDQVRALQQEISELRRKLGEVEAERDLYWKMVNTWAKTSFTEEELQQWDRIDEQGSGRTLLDVIEEVKRESA